jgi:antitoxin (DNA-binding transcriptional repressor) of toxin-antitoxin stability system
MSIRELRNQSALIQRSAAEEFVTLTAKGRPFSLVIRLKDGEDPGELERLIGQARAQRAISHIRDRAQATGLDQLTSDDLDEEIRLARAARAR